jgi:hypothetical protein
MPKYFAQFISENKSYGVLIVPKKLMISEVAENIILIWEIFTNEDWINRIAFLPL